MFQRQNPVPNRRIENDDCEIEIKNTSQGKKIKFKGKCSKEQLKILSQENEINLEQND